MTDRRLLQAAVVLLAAQLIVNVVPGPFRQCAYLDTGLTQTQGSFGEVPVSVWRCVDTWWPVGARSIGWIPDLPAPRRTLAPGETVQPIVPERTLWVLPTEHSTPRLPTPSPTPGRIVVPSP